MAAVFRRASACLATVAALLAAMVLPAAQPAAAVLSCPAKVLLVGDSITAMMGDFPRLRELLTQAGCVSTQMYNAGVPTKGVGDVTTAAPFLINAVKPDLIVYMIGTNDDPNGFQPRYAASVQAMRDAGGPGLKILASINQCPMVPPAATWIQMPSKNNAIYGADFDMTAGKFKPNIVGFLSNDRIPSSLMDSSGMHPTAEAQGYIQEYMYDATAVVYGLPRQPINPRATGGRCS